MKNKCSLFLFPGLVVVLLIGMACAPSEEPPESSRMLESTSFGEVEGEEVTLYTLTNESGSKVGIINYGGIVVSLHVPDRDGNLGDVVLGFDDLEVYVADTPYFGAIIGRYGNRIAGASFKINDTSYSLPVNNGPNSLHGGIKGFDKVVWDSVSTDQQDGVVLTYVSADGEEGYPGNLTSQVTYIWTDANELQIYYEATTDKPTVINLTNHSYFNLLDAGMSPILDHEMLLNADNYTPVNENLIPTGLIVPVEGTPFDFRSPVAIEARIADENEQLEFGIGYDHNFVINRMTDDLVLAAIVHEPQSGRVMEVLTTEPGVQFYTGNFLDGHLVGKEGTSYGQRHAFCLETQHYPDSPNQPDFPTTQLNPGETYTSQTVYRFSVRN